ncbi:MAG TPA: RnfABCDGE type electron transport complex subunit D [Firmicutes bacterium]|nr:RnfABCDGE type electron transport complex subunit D [Candidatus Fermentithermobacillaceae bacterium]
MEEKLVISSSPHIKDPKTVRGIMLDVIIALIPACLASLILFGWKALLIIVASVASAVASEALYEKAVKREVTVGDLSAVITGILLAMTLPPNVPLWIPVIGSAFAIVIAKQIFGGLGCNFVNPALAGRAFLLAAWPMHMTRDWLNPLTYDAVTSATPLAVLKGTGQGTLPGIKDFLLGVRLGSLGETSVLALLLGGIYLIVRGVIDYRIPLGFLGTLFVGTLVFGKPGAFFQGDGLSAILAGGAFLGAFFMATDYVTSPVTARGRLYMGIGAGFITLLIRLWGGYPEGVTYGILLMNLVTPLIDRFVVPRYYGYADDRAAKEAAAGGR